MVSFAKSPLRVTPNEPHDISTESSNCTGKLEVIFTQIVSIRRSSWTNIFVGLDRAVNPDADATLPEMVQRVHPQLGRINNESSGNRKAHQRIRRVVRIVTCRVGKLRGNQKLRPRAARRGFVRLAKLQEP